MEFSTLNWHTAADNQDCHPERSGGLFSSVRAFCERTAAKSKDRGLICSQSRSLTALLLTIALLLVTPGLLAQTESNPKPEVHSLKITILSTMLADNGIGEWGFAALVEADGHKILFDTGARSNTVLENVRELK